MTLEEQIFKDADEIGPGKVLLINDAKTKLQGILVVDNVARGPAIGGLRMAPNVTIDEVIRLARSMTFKNSAADIRHGGAKGGIVADPTTVDKYDLIRAFARAIKSITDYIPGPDMGTDEKCMAIVHDEIGRAVGLPRVLGGIPIDEIGITGYGVVISIEMANTYLKMKLPESTVAIEGFGSVGRATIRYLVERNAKVVAVSDSKGTIYNPNGLNYIELEKVKTSTGSVINYKEGERLNNEELFLLDVDILIPGARPDVISIENVNKVNAKLIVEAANIPITLEAEKILHQRGILVIPDIIANAGGVIGAAVEYRGGEEEEAFEVVKAKISRNVKNMLDLVYSKKIPPRDAAEGIARERVIKSMTYRGLL